MPFDVLNVKIGSTVSALACRKNPQTKKWKKKPSKDNFTCTGVKNPWAHRNEILHDGRAPWRSYCAKLDDDRFSHFRVVGGRISGFPIDFGSRPYVPECDTPASNNNIPFLG